MKKPIRSTSLDSFSHGVLRLVCAATVLGLVACGGSEAGGPSESTKDGFPVAMLPDELVSDLPLVAPKSDLELPVFSGIVDVAPGEDVTFCTFSDVILDEATIFAESYGAQSPQGHHAILQYTTEPTEPGTRPCSEGGDMGSTILLGGTGGKGVADTPTLPENYGVEVPAGAQLVMNHHWINTSDEPVRGQSMMLARRLERGGDTVLAGNMIMLGFGWEIPAQAQHTFETECTFQEDVSYVMALGHMHEWGEHVSIAVTRADGSGVDSVVDRPWSADDATGASGQQIYSLEDPLQIYKGDKVKLSCSWQNDTNEPLGFPREMCIFFGYTVGQSFFCANDIWLDAEAAREAGSQDIIDAL